MRENVTIARLESEINLYSKKSGKNQKLFKTFQIIELITAAFIPYLATSGFKIFTAASGVVIIVAHGIQNLFQFQEHWISYRSTAESLKHEKYLWKAKAGPYNDIKEPDKLLAERVESLISQEHAKWIVDKEKLKKNSSLHAIISS